MWCKEKTLVFDLRAPQHKPVGCDVTPALIPPHFERTKCSLCISRGRSERLPRCPFWRDSDEAGAREAQSETYCRCPPRRPDTRPSQTRPPRLETRRDGRVERGAECRSRNVTSSGAESPPQTSESLPDTSLMVLRGSRPRQPFTIGNLWTKGLVCEFVAFFIKWRLYELW